MIFNLLFKVLFAAILKVNSENDVSDATVGEILASREGVVRNESFIYLYVYHEGHINLSLKSSLGDADLYISERNLLPTYNVDSYDLHSATCGIDVINLPAKFGSPISIGIYGHPAFERSTFILEVVKQSSEITSYATITDEVPEFIENKYPVTGGNSNLLKTAVKLKNKKIEKMSNKLSGIFSLLEVFQLIFL